MNLELSNLDSSVYGDPDNYEDQTKYPTDVRSALGSFSGSEWAKLLKELSQELAGVESIVNLIRSINMYTQKKGYIEVWLDDRGVNTLQVWDPSGIPTMAYTVLVTIPVQVEVREDYAHKVEIKELVERGVVNAVDSWHFELEDDNGNSVINTGAGEASSEITSEGLL